MSLDSAHPSHGANTPDDLDVAYLMRLVSRLKDERQQRGLTLRELSRMTGISYGHLSRAERGLNQAGVVVLRRYCRALDLQFSSVCKEADSEGT